MRMAYFQPYRLQFAGNIIAILFWVIMFGVPFFFTDFEDGFTWDRILNISRPNISLFIAFLVNRFILLPKLFFNRKRGQYLLAVFLLLLALFVGNSMFGPSPPAELRPPAREMGFQPTPPPLGNNLERPRPDTGRPSQHLPVGLVSSFLCLLIIGVDTGINSAVKLIRKEKEHTILEKENMRNQLAFLRNQISPHFFMNTLNNIHSLIDIDTEEAKDTVIRLSKLMRHLLYDSEAERLALKQEIEFIKSYVELMKLRYPSKVDIVLETPEHIPEKKIPPLLFTSVIENAFKYGISYNKASFVHISLQIQTDSLLLLVRNSKHFQGKKEPYSGIGLPNTRKRLDLLYQDQYSLEVMEEEDIYTVKLYLPL